MKLMTELNVVGGHLGLDLVNTVEPRVPDRSVGREHLGSPEELLTWAMRVGVLTQEEADEVAAAWQGAADDRSVLDAVREIREALYDALLAELGSEAVDARPVLDVLQRHWSGAISRARLSLEADGATGDRLYIGTDPAMRLPDRLADAAVDLLRSLDVGQLKTCPLQDGGCGWLFLDRSRNSSRRWCSMDDCGARAKARRLTDRRRRARSS
jgi:predicted RNA-binding Zn ribbon-like protein